MALGILDIFKFKQALNKAIEECQVGKITNSDIISAEIQPVALCPSCGSEAIVVVDSRHVDTTIKRRRKCLDCDSRHITYEITERDYEELVRAKLMTKGECDE